MNSMICTNVLPHSQTKLYSLFWDYTFHASILTLFTLTLDPVLYKNSADNRYSSKDLFCVCVLVISGFISGDQCIFKTSLFCSHSLRLSSNSSFFQVLSLQLFVSTSIQTLLSSSFSYSYSFSAIISPCKL